MGKQTADGRPCFKLDAHCSDPEFSSSSTSTESADTTLAGSADGSSEASSRPCMGELDMFPESAPCELELELGLVYCDAVLELAACDAGAVSSRPSAESLPDCTTRLQGSLHQVSLQMSRSRSAHDCVLLTQSALQLTAIKVKYAAHTQGGSDLGGIPKANQVSLCWPSQ